uniref:Uncharacterized protein n=1 Tax=Panagrellus redivivus TaxID=6233 RepID=A0A7E4WB32_PANRE
MTRFLRQIPRDAQTTEEDTSSDGVPLRRLAWGKPVRNFQEFGQYRRKRWQQIAMKSREGSCERVSEAASHISARECDIGVPAAMILDFLVRRLEKSDESKPHPYQRPRRAESGPGRRKTAEMRLITMEREAETSIRKGRDRVVSKKRAIKFHRLERAQSLALCDRWVVRSDRRRR